MLTETDGESFANLCKIRSRLIWIAKELKKIHAGKLTSEKLPFFLKEERLYMGLFRQHAPEFGLTPRGRVGLTVGKKDIDSDDL